MRTARRRAGVRAQVRKGGPPQETQVRTRNWGSSDVRAPGEGYVHQRPEFSSGHQDYRSSLALHQLNNWPCCASLFSCKMWQHPSNNGRLQGPNEMPFGNVQQAGTAQMLGIVISLTWTIPYFTDEETGPEKLWTCPGLHSLLVTRQEQSSGLPTAVQADIVTLCGGPKGQEPLPFPCCWHGHSPSATFRVWLGWVFWRPSFLLGHRSRRGCHWSSGLSCEARNSPPLTTSSSRLYRRAAHTHSPSVSHELAGGPLGPDEFQRGSLVQGQGQSSGKSAGYLPSSPVFSTFLPLRKIWQIRNLEMQYTINHQQVEAGSA